MSTVLQCLNKHPLDLHSGVYAYQASTLFLLPLSPLCRHVVVVFVLNCSCLEILYPLQGHLASQRKEMRGAGTPKNFNLCLQHLTVSGRKLNKIKLPVV